MGMLGIVDGLGGRVMKIELTKKESVLLMSALDHRDDAIRRIGLSAGLASYSMLEPLRHDIDDLKTKLTNAWQADE